MNDKIERMMRRAERLFAIATIAYALELIAIVVGVAIHLLRGK
jgi:hypothetical protein